jgi:hypothetical protein
MTFISHLDFHKEKIRNRLSFQKKKSWVEKNNFISFNNVSLSDSQTALKNTENSENNIRKKVNNGLIEDRFPCI